MDDLDQPVIPAPAATLLLLRQREHIEVFMVRRNDGMSFMPGALVFPGGKVDVADRDPKLRAICGDVWDVDDEQLGYRIAAIREAFEEAGVLLARDETGAYVCGKRLESLASYRPLLMRGEISMADFAREERLTLACDALAYCAHWITPSDHKRRFDTRFFLAISPDDHLGEHDGEESVASLWVAPEDLLAQMENADWYLLPPTQVNLRLLMRSQTVQEAFTRARAEIIPKIGDGGDARFPDIEMKTPPSMLRR